jgi:hypothetical protein
MKRSGERTHPCGEAVEVKRVSDSVWFTNTLCDLLVRKSIIHRVSWWLRWKRVMSFSARMCGCMLLNADEKSANRSLAVVLGVSRCLWMVFTLKKNWVSKTAAGPSSSLLLL